MRLLQFIDPNATPRRRLGLIRGDRVADLTACPPHPESMFDLYYRHGGCSRGLEAAVGAIDATGAPAVPLDELIAGAVDPQRRRLVSPVTAPEDQPHRLRIWLAGITHEDSAKLREIEAKQATGGAVNVYEQKYRECARGGIPELFAKTDSAGVRGHGGDIARPTDTKRLVPEAELVTVYGVNRDGQIERLGYTGGNDFTDNGIEAENPLNLPQAKNWANGCASLGPVFVTDAEFDDADVPVSCEVIRDGERVAYKQGRTGQANLNMPEALFHLERALFSRLPLEPETLLAFYWGTSVVFAEEDLKSGLVEGDITRAVFGGGIGALENTIVAFPDADQLRRLESSRRR